MSQAILNAMLGGNAKTSVVGSTIQQPIEIQSRYVDTFQTHNAVSIATTATSYSSYFACVNDTAGSYSRVAVTMQNSAAVSSTVKIRWSNDALTDNGEETILAAGSDQYRAGEVTVKAKYARIAITNNDGSSRTISAWAMLQA